MDEVKPQETMGTVTMDIPAEAVVTQPPIDTVVNPQQPTEEVKAETTELSTTNPQEQTIQAKTINEGGRPCEYCANKDEIDKKTMEYINLGREDKPRVLFLIELALRLDKHRETIMNWAHAKNEDGSLQHPLFFDMVKSVEQMQELRLQQRILGRYNPSGAIFLLKTKHGYIESEKRILAGDHKEPLEIVITEDNRMKNAED